MGIRGSILKRDYEELYDWLINIANKSKSLYAQSKIIESKSKILNTMLQLYDSELPLTYKNISQYSGVSIRIIKNNIELEKYVAEMQKHLNMG